MKNVPVIKKLKIIVLVCVLLSIAVLFCSCVNYEQENRDRAVNSINHRGYFEAPENTLSAFRMSAEKGFTMVETDVSFTKDGVAVLLHDSTVDRTSNGSGKISNLTFEEVSKLDFGSWKGEKFKGENVALFSDFIALCRELKLYPYIEIKSGATVEQVESLAKVVETSNLSVTWIARNKLYLLTLYKIRNGTKLGSKDRYGLIIDVITQSAIDSLSEINKGKLFIDANYLTLTETQIKLCKRNNVSLEVWTLNDENLIKNIDPYISGVTSDKFIATDVLASIEEET